MAVVIYLVSFKCFRLTTAIFLLKIHVLLVAMAVAVASAASALIDLKIQLLKKAWNLYQTDK